jgi:hypothetical protein
MAGETNDVVKGYLQRLLSEGTQPFSYRGSIRALLGLPEASGLEMNFFKPPATRFTYVVSQFMGEFEFSDELPTSNAPRGALLEKVAPSVFQGATTSAERERAVRERAFWACSPDRQAVRQTGQPSTLRMKEQRVAVPRSPEERGDPTRPDAPDRAENRPIDVEAPTGEVGSDSALKAHDLIVPTLRLPAPLAPVPESSHIDQDASESVTESQHEAAVRAPSRTGLARSGPKGVANALSPLGPEGDSTTPHQTVSASHIAQAGPGYHQLEPRATSRESADAVVPHEHLQARMRGVQFSEGAVLQHSITPTLHPHGFEHEHDAPGESVLSGKRLQAESSKVVRPRVRSRGPHAYREQVCRDATAERRSFPLMHTPDERRGSGVRAHSETRKQSSTDAAGQTPTVPLTQPSVFVIKQVSDQGSASFGFWERRYLTHLLVKIRR